jgi:glycosyltransferase involved in cell wall biosynthesis
MVGDGPILNDVRRLCRDRGLDDQFRFTGWVDHMTMPDWFNLADLVVMPSAREGLALVYLEAQASGCVLLASDIPAAREVITDGDNGLLFPPGNAAEIAGQVLRLGRDPVTRRQIAERARETVHNHRLGASVSRHLRILEEVSGVRIEPGTGQAVI